MARAKSKAKPVEVKEEVEVDRDPETGKLVVKSEPPAIPPKPPAPKSRKFTAVKVNMWHPFAKVRIPVGSPGVILDEPDSWLECQIKAGLVKEV